MRTSVKLLTVLSGGGAGGLTYLLRDDFTTTASAPLSSPRAAEPGPGSATYVQNDGQFSIVALGLNVPAQTTAAWGDLGAYFAAGIPRVVGRTLLIKFRWSVNNSGGTPLALFTAAALGGTSVAGIAEGFFVTNTGRLAVLSNGSIPFTEANPTLTGVDYTLAIMLLATGAYYYAYGGALYPTWTNIYTSAAGSQATLYPGWTNFNMVHVIRSAAVVDFASITTIASGNAALTAAFPNG